VRLREVGGYERVDVVVECTVPALILVELMELEEVVPATKFLFLFFFSPEALNQWN